MSNKIRRLRLQIFDLAASRNPCTLAHYTLLALTDENKVAAIRAANGTLASRIQPNKRGPGSAASLIDPFARFNTVVENFREGSRQNACERCAHMYI